MSTQNHNHSSSNEQDQTQRIGLWVGLGVAAVAAAGVLGLAFYINYQENHKNQNPAQVQHEHAQHATGTHSGTSQQPEIVSSIPTSEAQAASLAVANSDHQVQGMTAPAEESSENEASAPVAPVVASASVPAQAASAVAQPSPANVILENENAAGQTQVVNDNGVVKFTFATGKSDVAANTLQALNDVVEGVKTGKKAVVLSYAGVESNERLAKERAFAVRSVLLAAGVPESSIEVKEPTTVENDSRRVEVVLQ